MRIHTTGEDTRMECLAHAWQTGPVSCSFAAGALQAGADGGGRVTAHRRAVDRRHSPDRAQALARNHSRSNSLISYTRTSRTMAT